MMFTEMLELSCDVDASDRIAITGTFEDIGDNGMIYISIVQDDNADYDVGLNRKSVDKLIEYLQTTRNQVWGEDNE